MGSYNIILISYEFHDKRLYQFFTYTLMRCIYLVSTNVFDMPMNRYIANLYKKCISLIIIYKNLLFLYYFPKKLKQGTKLSHVNELSHVICRPKYFHAHDSVDSI